MLDTSAGKICVVRCIHEEDGKAWIQMSKKTHTNPLSRQEIEKLRKNPYIACIVFLKNIAVEEESSQRLIECGPVKERLLILRMAQKL